MAITTGSANQAFLPQAAGKLIVQPALAASIAAQVSTVVNTGSGTFRIPIVSADPTAAWTPEGTAIDASDPTLAELAVVPKKLAGLVVVSRELIEDSNPASAEVIGQGLARDIAKKLDAAFFANTTANGPSGLLSLTTSTATETETSFDTLDSFASAMFTVEGIGANVDSWITSPAEALALTTLKELSTGSNKPLLGADPTQQTARSVYGRPLYVSSAVGTKTAWGVPRDRVFLVVRSDARIEVDRSAFFTSDQVAVKATMRVGFGFPHPLAIVKVSHA